MFAFLVSLCFGQHQPAFLSSAKRVDLLLSAPSVPQSIALADQAKISDAESVVVLSTFEGERSLAFLSASNQLKHEDEQLFFSYGKAIGANFALSMSQRSHWKPHSSAFMKLRRLLGPIGDHSLLATFEREDANRVGLFWIDLDARGANPNRSAIFPVGKYKVLDSSVLGNVVEVLAAHGRRLEVFRWAKSSPLKRVLRPRTPRYRRILNKMVPDMFPHKKNAHEADFELFDPVGLKLVYGYSTEYDIITGRSQTLPGESQLGHLCYLNTELYSNRGYRLCHLDRKKGVWEDLGKYELMGTSYDGRSGVVRELDDGARTVKLWLARY